MKVKTKLMLLALGIGSIALSGFGGCAQFWGDTLGDAIMMGSWWD